MSLKILSQDLRVIRTTGEMTLRQAAVSPFIIFTVLVQPLLVAMLALWMLADKKTNDGIYVVVGTGMSGLWSSLLFICGNSITVERWTGTLEALVATPANISVIVCIWQEPRQRPAITGFNGRLLSGGGTLIQLPDHSRSTASVYYLTALDRDRLRQLRVDPRTAVSAQSCGTEFPKRHRIPDLYSGRVPIPDCAFAELDHPAELPSGALLGCTRLACCFKRRRNL